MLEVPSCAVTTGSLHTSMSLPFTSSYLRGRGADCFLHSFDQFPSWDGPALVRFWTGPEQVFCTFLVQFVPFGTGETAAVMPGLTGGTGIRLSYIRVQG